jgi:TolB protein
MERSPVWSPDGNKIAYISYHKDQAFHVVTAIDTIRSWLISELPAESYSPVSWSPDGKYIAFSSDHNLYISEFGKLPNNEQQTMYEQGELKRPSWAPTGDKIAYYFSPFHCCGSDIYALSTDKHNKLELQTSQIWAHSSHPIVWSPDGKSVVVIGDNNSKNWNLYKKNQGENKAVKITDSERRDACPDWEPQK